MYVYEIEKTSCGFIKITANSAPVIMAGALCGNVATLKIMPDILPDFDFTNMQDSDNVIVLSSKLSSFLSQEEINALIHHEVGHYINNHLQKAVDMGQAGMMNSLEFELEADAYSASKTSKKAMHDSLKKFAYDYLMRPTMVKDVIEVLPKKKRQDFIEFVKTQSQVVSSELNKMILPRLQALQ